jgi:homoserine O-succinyltransferase/O-acetyltransferase
VTNDEPTLRSAGVLPARFREASRTSLVVPPHPSGPFGVPGGHATVRPLSVVLVNLMADHALPTAHQQFARLILAAARGTPIELKGFVLPGVELGPAAQRLEYGDGGELMRSRPDAVVVTGAEPSEPDLEAEPFWEPLVQVLRWAEASVPSTMLSCLASHAALLALHGVRRCPRAAKRSGMVRQAVDDTHALGSGLGAVVALPHSRWNGVPLDALQAHGYDIVLSSGDGDWTVAQRTRNGRAMVLLQGHPEYLRTTLLREYRRDVRRFAAGESDVYPSIPTSYLDAEGERLLGAYREAHGCRRSSMLHAPFPFDVAASHIVASWDDTSIGLFSNWIADARRRAGRSEVRETVRHA